MLHHLVRDVPGKDHQIVRAAHGDLDRVKDGDVAAGQKGVLLGRVAVRHEGDAVLRTDPGDVEEGVALGRSAIAGDGLACGLGRQKEGAKIGKDAFDFRCNAGVSRCGIQPEGVFLGLHFGH